MAEHIESCPYCGAACSWNKEKNITGYYLFFISCDFCGAHGPKFYDKDKAITIWNNFVKNIYGVVPIISRLDIEEDYCCEKAERWG